MPVIEYPNGLKIRTFPVPPEGFDPHTASSARLRKHGLPFRPSPKQPQLLKQWTQVAAKAKHYIVPTFRRREDLTRSKRPKKKFQVTGTEFWPTSAGAVSYAAPGETFSWVAGTFTAPNVTPLTTDGTVYEMSAWVGLDGDKSSDVVQAGVDNITYNYGQGLSLETLTWFEWYPANIMEISNFQISPGDLITVSICIPTGGNSASFSLTNHITGVHTSFGIDIPPGVTFAGNCAEWIVERPNGNLPNYGAVYFDNAQAGYAPATVNAQASDGYLLSMVDSVGHIISYPTPETDTLVKVTYGSELDT